MPTLMPTSSVTFSAVAACLAGIDPLDRGAVSGFYRRLLRDYPAPVRTLIADFLIGLSGPPSAGALDRLKRAVLGAVPRQPVACDLPELCPAGLDPPPRRRRPAASATRDLPAVGS